MKLLQVLLASSMIMAQTYAQFQNQNQQYTTPVPILKQINRHNEDGSYSYGYEGADGSYKIESKYPDGRVFGKYGYKDESGQIREVEYGANQHGFQPAGSGINVPPPTITNNNNYPPLSPGQEDDGQYREDPSIYYKDEKYNQPVQRTHQQSNIVPPPIFRQQTEQPAFRPQSHFFSNPAPAPAPAPVQQQYYNPQPQPQQYNYNPQPQPQQYNYNPQPQPQYSNQAAAPFYVDPNLFRGHPASNFDVASGSYTINYTGRR